MKILEEIQKSIIKKKGIYMVYIIIFIFTFLFPLDRWTVYLELFRAVYSTIGFLIILTVYFALKGKREPREDRVIKFTLSLFFALSLAAAYTFYMNLA